MASDPIRIQRYPNRRFYDRAHRRYVTLAEIEDLVRQGRVVKVQDSKSGEDLTRQVLTQILLERHPEKMELFPIALLHGLLRANDLANGLWEAYLRQALLALDNLQRAMPPLSTPLAWLPTWLPGWPAPAPAPPAEAAEPLAERLAALEDRIMQLEAHSAHAAGGKAGGTSSGSLAALEGRVSGLEKDSTE
ncbi:MAG: polyhydroxyalkanoate synthesis regulator DNA-binding domain-containing protein [Isosphaeraceae bacterium]